MNRILIIFLIFGFYSCVEKQKPERKTKSVEVEKTDFNLKYFELLKNFEQNKEKFGKPDTFELNEDLIEGGELKVFHYKSFNYVVLDFWLYGETRKLNYIYWTEKDNFMEFKFVKQSKYEYDKPYYEKNIKIDTTIQYLSYSDQKIKLFDFQKKEITESKQIKKTKMELDLFFKEVTRGIEIIK